MNRQIAKILPRVIETLESGSSPYQYYLGEGNDGTCFKMFDPSNPEDRSFDNLVVKIWKPNFHYRFQEIELHNRAFALKDKGFKVPKIHHVDYDRNCFVMDHVPGRTFNQTIRKEGRFIEESLFEDLLACCDELAAVRICHNDAHDGNIMLSDVVVEEDSRGRAFVVDADWWIIDYGRSVEASTPHVDIARMRKEMGDRVAELE